MIHPQAIIDPAARLGNNVSVGPWSWIGPGVEIGEDTWIGPNVVIRGPTRIGRHNKIYQFASLGEDPQDKKYAGEPTRLDIGDHNIFREACTVNRGTVQGGGLTRIGDHNLFMAYTHVAHDCIIENHVVFSNNASVAGHVQVCDYAILGGFVGIFQFCVIGAYSFLAGGSMVTKDVLPYVKVSGYPARVHGLNTVGLERMGFSSEVTQRLRKAYKIIFRQNLTVPEAIDQLSEMFDQSSELDLLITFLRSSTRGIAR